jgi:bla regulator protein blaR1
MTSMLPGFLGLTISGSCGILAVLILRRPARRLLGAAPTMWIWLLVPALLIAAVLPARIPMTPHPAPHTGLIQIATDVMRPVKDAPVFLGSAVIWVWLAGASVMLLYVIAKHVLFLRSLRPIPRSRDTWTVEAVREPLLLGVFAPRICLPSDFHEKYTADEQALIVAHERSHICRRDPVINLLAVLYVCVFWFNPLSYLGWHALRFDQELACDADALERGRISRRLYAATLLKVQLQAETLGLVPLGCQWKPIHPLKERILMLNQPVLPHSRRSLGRYAAVGVTLVAGAGAWIIGSAGHAATAGSTAAGGEIAVTVAWSVDGQTGEGGKIAAHSGKSTELRVSDGGHFKVELGDSGYSLGCRVRRLKNPPKAPILFTCRLVGGDETIARASFLTLAGEPAMVELSNDKRATTLTFLAQLST